MFGILNLNHLELVQQQLQQKLQNHHLTIHSKVHLLQVFMITICYQSSADILFFLKMSMLLSKRLHQQVVNEEYSDNFLRVFQIMELVQVVLHHSHQLKNFLISPAIPIGPIGILLHYQNLKQLQVLYFQLLPLLRYQT